MHINEINDPEVFEYKGITLDKKVDFYITISEGKFLIDFFNSSIDNLDEAYLDSFESDDVFLKDVVADAEKYTLTK